MARLPIHGHRHCVPCNMRLWPPFSLEVVPPLTACPLVYLVHVRPGPWLFEGTAFTNNFLLHPCLHFMLYLKGTLLVASLPEQ